MYNSFRIAEYESENEIQKFKMVDLKWWSYNFEECQNFFELKKGGFYGS